MSFSLAKTRLLIGLLVLVLCPGSALCRDSHSHLTETELREAINLLTTLGYWTGGAEAESDRRLYFATIAFQRVAGLSTTGELSLTDLAVLRSRTPLQPHSSESYHIEIDLHRQVLFVVEPGGVVRSILPISSGSGKPFPFKGHTETGRTPIGNFQVYRKIDGWHDSQLGSMYYSSYIYRGIAVHGSRVFAETPSTHGCVSIPAAAADELSRLMPIGTLVMVYD